MVTGSDKSVRRLATVLGVDSGTCTGMTMDFPAGGLCRLIVQRILTADEIKALSEWFVTEGISPIQTGTTTYSLQPREQEDGQSD